jgi:coenzyme F420 biosynthesis associated uncharacterized protein
VSVVDWDLAGSIATGFAPTGPDVSASEVRAMTRQLGELAEQATLEVHAITGLVAAPGHRTIVADRHQWIRSNIDALAALTAPLDERVGAGAVHALGSRATALQIGATLGWMSGRVLGQYEVVAEPGSLLLVAPTIAATERSLDVPATDFRLWVCLHEEAHRVQFGAVPWLRDYFIERVRILLELPEMGLRDSLMWLSTVVTAFARALRGSSDLAVADLVPTEEQRAALRELMALMTILEGHADVVMDLAGPDVIPSVAVIRERFEVRRDSAHGMDRIIRTLLGVEAKMRQYRDGATFIRSLLESGGMERVNALWSGPGALPSLEELSAPQQWAERTAA